MNTKPEREQIISLIEVLVAIALVALLLALGSVSRAQQPSVEFEPAALEKVRTELFLKSSQTALADLENDLNHLAVLSETCRVEFGAKVCGLENKPLVSDKIEERFAYYVRQPVQTHFNGHHVKVDRHSWETTNAAASR